MDGEVTLPELTRAEILEAVKKARDSLRTTRLRGLTENAYRLGVCCGEDDLSRLLYRAKGIDPDTL